MRRYLNYAVRLKFHNLGKSFFPSLPPFEPGTWVGIMLFHRPSSSRLEDTDSPYNASETSPSSLAGRALCSCAGMLRSVPTLPVPTAAPVSAGTATDYSNRATIESARNRDTQSSAAPHAVLASVHNCSEPRTRNQGAAGGVGVPVAGHRDTARGPHEPTSRSRQTIAEVNASPHTVTSQHFTGIVQVPY